MKKILIPAIVILVLALGYFIYKSNQSSQTNQITLRIQTLYPYELEYDFTTKDDFHVTGKFSHRFFYEKKFENIKEINLHLTRIKTEYDMGDLDAKILVRLFNGSDLLTEQEMGKQDYELNLSHKF